MHSAFRWNIRFAILALTCGAVFAQLPEGPGRDETRKVCSACHEIERSISLRQDRDAWKTTINKMISLGATATEQEITATLEYLAAHYPASAAPMLNVNTARAIDFESRLSLKRSESAAIVKYRDDHGDFKSIDDLEKVPGIDYSKIRARKDILVF
jgi:competence protein ComEA